MADYGTKIFSGVKLGSLSGVVTTITDAPGFALGDTRTEDGITYRLVYNAGGASITAGYFASPVPTAGGMYSVTVTTVSGSWNNFGAVVAHQATVPTAVYFWGAVKGYLASGVAGITTLTVSKPFCIGADGKVDVQSAIASGYVSGNIMVGFTTTAPAAGTAAVRQGGVWINTTAY